MSARIYIERLATVLVTAFTLVHLNAQEAQKDSSKWSLISIKVGAPETDIELHSAKSGKTTMKAAHFVCRFKRRMDWHLG